MAEVGAAVGADRLGAHHAVLGAHRATFHQGQQRDVAVDEHRRRVGAVPKQSDPARCRTLYVVEAAC